MIDTTYSRKLDTQGRIMIPIRLREQMNMQIGHEYNFYTLETNGRKFICIDCGASVTDKDLERAKQILVERGIFLSE